jgi:hypothetical protein
MTKIKTIQIKTGRDTSGYAKVADRLKLFWEENPSGKIDTERVDLLDGKVRFVAHIWRDKEDFLETAKSCSSVDVLKMTADATASADSVKRIGGEKENEKLETIAVGRALAMLGYLSSGEVASREEMEEFNKYKFEKEEAEEAVNNINKIETLKDLRALWVSIRPNLRSNELVLNAKDKRKNELSEAPIGGVPA